MKNDPEVVKKTKSNKYIDWNTLPETNSQST